MREEFVIPSRLDDPERWLFWTMDEAMMLFVPPIWGLFSEHLVIGILVGVSGCFALRKLKSRGQLSIVRHAAYWYLPSSLLKLKATPDSAVRFWLG